jgi:hypothetical protein
MKPVTTDQIVRDVDALPEDKRLQVVEFIRSLKNGPAKPMIGQSLVAARLRVLEDMNRLAKEIGEHWQEDADAAELVSSMRR